MISLIATVLNERKNLPQWFEGLKKQTVQPDEIIVVDGASTDGTWQYLNEMRSTMPKLRIFQEEGNIAHGRNFAIRQSAGQVIVVTDAGCTFDENWLKSITEAFANKENAWSATAFGPWFELDDKMIVYAIASSTIPAKSEFKKNWLPSSRSVAFQRHRWQTVGGYPEWVPFCEDVLLDLKLKRKDGYPVFVREPMVFWRPRTSIGKYLKQLFNYTRSEGHALINTTRQVIRFFVYGVSLSLLVLSFLVSGYFIIPVLVGLPVYMMKFWKRWNEFTRRKSFMFRLVGYFVVACIVAFGDIAKMAGWIGGVAERKLGSVQFETY
jgi:glycosyltransferase involved in cell wall biosynthesis